MALHEIIDNAPLIRQEEVRNIIGCKATSVQVAGTNGKGSTCAFLSSVLISHGKRVGLYISPHVNDICERISINGENISYDEFERLVTELDCRQGGMCKSDLMFFAAVRYFNDQNVDAAIFETGLGGSRDSATLINHDYAIITQIGYDHTEFLGNTLERITVEKAGIVKSGMKVYAYPNPTNDIVATVCANRNAELKALLKKDICFVNNSFSFNIHGLLMSNIHLSMKGEFQSYNCVCALLCARDMLGNGFDVALAKKAVENTVVYGRMSVLKEKPLVMADVSHNPDGVNELCKYISGLNGNKCAIVSIQKTKDYKTIMNKIKGTFDLVIGVKADCASRDPLELEADICTNSLENAYNEAVKKNMNIIAFCGSFAVVREASALNI